MKYISTRGSKREYSFTEAFLESFAEDGGLFCPKEIPRISAETLEKWSHLNFFDLYLAILSIFINEEDIRTDDLEVLLRSTFDHFHQRELVTMKSVGPVSFAESFYGPTYHIKDFSMQFIGHFLKYLVKKDEKNDSCQIYAVVVGTDSDTGASMLSGIGFIDYRVNGFSIYPRNKIDYIQEREMISNVASNGHSLCMENSGIAEVLQITRDLVTHNVHRDRIHIISANSGHIVRVLCELPLLFYAYFHSVAYPKSVAFSSYVANLKSTYVLCMARDMGLPIHRVVLSCHPHSSVEEFFQKGEYQTRTRLGANKEEVPFIHSNLERILFYLMHSDVSKVMDAVERRERVKLPLEEVRKCFDFIDVIPISNEITSQIITLLYQNSHYLVCPNAADAFAVGMKYLYRLQKGDDSDPLDVVFRKVVTESDGECKVVCLSTAHPGKFPYFVAEALNAPAGNIMPKDIQNLPLRNSRISVIPNDLAFIRNYISHICFDCIKQLYHLCVCYYY